MSSTLLDCPAVLFRAFKCRTHAEDFVKGRFRMGSLASYRNASDASRRDLSEGIASYRSAGGVSTTTTNGNVGEQYILCCSTERVDLNYLRSKMGEHVARISNPLALAKAIEQVLSEKGVATLNGVHGRLVEYSKGELRSAELSASDNFDLSLRQKELVYAKECEYRVFFILGSGRSVSVQTTHYYRVDLGKRLEYAEICRSAVKRRA